jgi:hypothetical protein
MKAKRRIQTSHIQTLKTYVDDICLVDSNVLCYNVNGISKAEAEKMRSKIIFTMLGVLLSTGGLVHADAWTTLDYSGATGTYIQGISGNNIVGYYTDASGYKHGFLYNGTTWSSINISGANNASIDVIDGDSYAGTYWNNLAVDQHGFWYDGTNLTTFQTPSSGDRLNIGGLSNGTIAGDYRGGPTSHPTFLYNGTTWTEVTVPLGDGAHINGIDGDNLVGTYSYSSHGFFYDGTTWSTLDVPSISGTIPVLSTPMDIDGKNIVGYFQDMSQIDTTFKGFLYDGSNWSIIEMPGSRDTRITGIDGSILVGTYVDASNNAHGFSYTIPEPTTISLLLFGVVAVRKLGR